jgi:hypothetical protein
MSTKIEPTIRIYTGKRFVGVTGPQDHTFYFDIGWIVDGKFTRQLPWDQPHLLPARMRKLDFSHITLFTSFWTGRDYRGEIETSPDRNYARVELGLINRGGEVREYDREFKKDVVTAGWLEKQLEKDSSFTSDRGMVSTLVALQKILKVKKFIFITRDLVTYVGEEQGTPVEYDSVYMGETDNRAVDFGTAISLVAKLWEGSVKYYEDKNLLKPRS